MRSLLDSRRLCLTPFSLLFVLLCTPAGLAQQQYSAGALEETEESMAWLPVMPTVDSVDQDVLPRQVDLTPWFPPPGNQGKLNSCVGWAVGYAVCTYFEALESGIPLQDPETGMVDANRVFSPAFLYNTNNFGRDGGSQATEVLKYIRDHGAAPWSAMPYRLGDFSTQPDAAAKQVAAQYRIKKWTKLEPVSVIGLKRLLYDKRPIIISLRLSKNFWDLGPDDVYREFAGGDPGQHSNHAVVLVGYDDDRGAFRLMNSWGTDWGDGGFGWVSYAHASRAINQAIVAEDKANYDLSGNFQWIGGDPAVLAYALEKFAGEAPPELLERAQDVAGCVLQLEHETVRDTVSGFFVLNVPLPEVTIRVIYSLTGQIKHAVCTLTAALEGFEMRWMEESGEVGRMWLREEQKYYELFEGKVYERAMNDAEAAEYYGVVRDEVFHIRALPGGDQLRMLWRWDAEGTPIDLTFTRVDEATGGDVEVTAPAATEPLRQPACVVVGSQIRQTWTHRYQSSEQFPEAWINGQVQQGLLLVSAGYAGGFYDVATGTIPGATSQVWRHGPQLPEAWIKEHWGKGYRITLAEYVHDRWLLAMTQGVALGEQTYFQGSDFPWDQVDSKLAAGYAITSVTYAKGGWFVVMTLDAPYGDQMVLEQEFLDMGGVWDGWLQHFNVTDVDYGNGLWIVVLSQGGPYGRQVLELHNTAGLPLNAANRLNEAGFQLTRVTGGMATTSPRWGEEPPTGWGVVVAKKSGLGLQLAQFGDAFPSDWVNEQLKQGFRITEATWGDGQWLVLVSKDTGFEEQRFTVGWELPLEWMEEAWQQGYMLTRLARGNGEWVAVMTKGTGYTEQDLIGGEYFPSEEVQAYWKEGWTITQAAFGEGQWLVVLSKGTGFSDQVAEVVEVIPLDAVQDLQQKGFHLTEVHYGWGEWTIVMSQGRSLQSERVIPARSLVEVFQAVLAAQKAGERVLHIYHGHHFEQ